MPSSPPGGGGRSSPISSPHPRGSLPTAPSCGLARAQQQGAGSPPCLSLPNSSGTKENKTPPADRFIGNFAAGLAQTPRPRSTGTAARTLLGSSKAGRGTVPAHSGSPDATLQTWPCLSPASTCPGCCLHPACTPLVPALPMPLELRRDEEPVRSHTMCWCALVAPWLELGAVQLASLRNAALTSSSFILEAEKQPDKFSCHCQNPN